MDTFGENLAQTPLCVQAIGDWAHELEQAGTILSVDESVKIIDDFVTGKILLLTGLSIDEVGNTRDPCGLLTASTPLNFLALERSLRKLSGEGELPPKFDEAIQTGKARLSDIIQKTKPILEELGKNDNVMAFAKAMKW